MKYRIINGTSTMKLYSRFKKPALETIYSYGDEKSCLKSRITILMLLKQPLYKHEYLFANVSYIFFCA